MTGGRGEGLFQGHTVSIKGNLLTLHLWREARDFNRTCEKAITFNIYTLLKKKRTTSNTVGNR